MVTELKFSDDPEDVHVAVGTQENPIPPQAPEEPEAPKPIEATCGSCPYRHVNTCRRTVPRALSMLANSGVWPVVDPKNPDSFCFEHPERKIG